MSKLKRALVVPDTHAPYEHKRAYNIMLERGVDLDPHEVVLLGDYGEFLPVSSHDKHPSLLHALEQEVEGVRKRLDELDKLFPRAKKVYLEGNHEFRLERYLIKQAPALFGLTSWIHVLGLDKRKNWHPIAYGTRQLYQVLGSHLYARHEPYSMSSAKASVDQSKINLVYGHKHIIEESMSVGANDKAYMNYCPGWLGDKRFDKVFGYTPKVPHWRLGFSEVYVDPVTRMFYSQKNTIMENGTCVINGRLYR